MPRAPAARAQYDIDKVFKQYMLPALKVVEQRFANQHPVTIAPRAQGGGMRRRLAGDESDPRRAELTQASSAPHPPEASRSSTAPR
jgi:hypothetical protein